MRADQSVETVKSLADPGIGCTGFGTAVRASGGGGGQLFVGDAEFLEKAPGHGPVVVLPGMNQAITQRPSPLLRLLQRVDDRGNLHEVGPGSGNEIDAFYHVVRFVRVSFRWSLLRLLRFAYIPARVAEYFRHR